MIILLISLLCSISIAQQSGPLQVLPRQDLIDDSPVHSDFHILKTADDASQDSLLHSSFDELHTPGDPSHTTGAHSGFNTLSPSGISSHNTPVHSSLNILGSSTEPAHNSLVHSGLGGLNSHGVSSHNSPVHSGFGGLNSPGISSHNTPIQSGFKVLHSPGAFSSISSSSSNPKGFFSSFFDGIGQQNPLSNPLDYPGGDFLSSSPGLQDSANNNIGFSLFDDGDIGLRGCGPQIPPCQHSNYRTFDGSCNNPNRPLLGAANTPYARVKAPKYADGVSEPPVSVSGRPLPNPRILSVVLFPDIDIKDPKFTLIAMQWGQIITHDMSLAAGTTQGKAHDTSCCSPDNRQIVPKEHRDPSCFPIEIPHDDPAYGQEGQQCMNFVRTTTDISQGCGRPFKGAEQIVAVTHYMDVSIIYGSSEQVSDSVREFRGGRLRVDLRHGRIYPPQALNKTAVCDNIQFTESCYVTGDQRVNQNPQLTILHIVLIREHNRVATVLSQLNPHWDDERLFQEARRIVIGEHQHISYYEWIPIFLGWAAARSHGLIHDTPGYTHDYNDRVDPSVINGHATAAFRHFHSNIAGFLHLITEHRTSYGTLRLSDHFNRPSVIEQGNNFDDLIRGMTTQNQMYSDQFFTSEVTNFLFRNGQQLGQDLRAIDIQRGRDHGLASYNQYRRYCGLPLAEKFEDFHDYMNEENVAKLAQLYENVEDVDFVVGGSLESHVNGAMVGPTFLCILVEQFYRTRAGDRFFYENGDSHYPFTPEQLHEIRKSSISRLLCDNGDDIFSMQPDGFEKISHENPVVPCSRIDVIPVVNLEAWKEDGRRYGKK